MEEVAEISAVIHRCGRCLQPVSYQTPRCTNCGQPNQNTRRKILIATAVVGILALLFLVVMVYRAELQYAALIEEEQNTPAEEFDPPTTSQDVPPPVIDEKAAPVAPDKPPPLNR